MNIGHTKMVNKSVVVVERSWGAMTKVSISCMGSRFKSMVVTGRASSLNSFPQSLSIKEDAKITVDLSRRAAMT